MENITGLIGDLLTGLGGLVVFASVIAKLTPTPKDDAFCDKMLKLINKFSISAATDKKEDK